MAVRSSARRAASRDVVLFAIESQAELDEIQCALAGPPQAARAPTTHPARDPHAGFV
jgi:hypothetical protein